MITYEEFKLFEELLCSPDVLYKCAFQLFDRKGTGLIDFGKLILKFKLVEIIKHKISLLLRIIQGNNEPY